MSRSFLPSALSAPKSAGSIISAESRSPELLGAIRALISPETARVYSRAQADLAAWLDGRELSDRLFAEYLAELFTFGCRSAADCSGRPLRLVAAAVRFALRQADAEFPVGPLTMRADDGFKNAGRGRGTGQVDGVGLR